MRHLIWIASATLALTGCEQALPKWEVTTERDSLRDTNMVFARLNSNEKISPEVSKSWVEIRVINGGVTTTWGDGLQYCSRRQVAYRFDKEEVAFLECQPRGQLLPETKWSQLFLDRAFQPSDSLVLEGEYDQYTFDTTGLSAAIIAAESSGVPSRRR